MIKAIIFDIGGVIQGLDWSIVVNNLIDIKPDLNMDTYQEALYYEREKFFNEYCKGNISKDDFWKMVSKRLNLNESHISRLSRSFEELYCFIDEKLISIVRHLKNSHKLFILANTTPELEIKALRNNNYLFLFDKAYFSHKIGARKPDKASFQIILDENKLLPEECVFVDNDMKNISAAKKLNFHCILYMGPDAFVSSLYDVIEKNKRVSLKT